MTDQQMIAVAILGLTLAMLVWGRWRYDLVAVAALLAVVLTGLVPAAHAFDGFSHPAVVTVAAVLIISKGLQNAALVDAVVAAIGPLRGRLNLQLIAQCVVVAVLSSFMNNVGALALIMPVALRNAYRDGYAPSRSLMPLAFASLLGGMTTLIGTPPNIIIASFRARETGQAFTMFDFAPVGLAVAGAGLAYLVLLGWRLLPSEERKSANRPVFAVEGYITEAEIPEGSKAVGMTVFELEKLADDDAVIAGIIRDDQRRLIPNGHQRLGAGDILVLRGDTGALTSMIDAAGLKLVGDKNIGRDDLKSDDIELVEVVVNSGSRLLGTTPIQVRLRSVFGVNLLAIARQGRRIDQRLGHVRFLAGDVMLLQVPRGEMAEILARLGCLPLAERQLGIGRKRRLVLAGGMFAAGIACVVAGWLPVHVAFTAVAAGLVATNIVRPSEVYSAVDWPVIVLLAAMFPVGGAIESTGAAALAAGTILDLTGGLAVGWVLLVLLLCTMWVSDVINNNATAVLMAPIALTVAQRLGLSADPFLMAVAVGSSCAFLTPIGHQSNTLVMEPAGYRFGDYWRVGLPLDAVIAVVAIPMILWVWPP
jgi:di/tricarboxylate transporter